MEQLPVSSADLEISKDDEVYTTLNKLEARLAVSRPTLIKVRELGIRSLWGRTPTMQRVQFYCVSDTVSLLKRYKQEHGWDETAPP
jgi:hypothetical protein